MMPWDARWTAALRPTKKPGTPMPPLVICEVGIGHEGRLDKAIATVDACADAGAEVVKFQCHIPDAEMAPGHEWLDAVAACAFDEKQERVIKARVEERGMVYLSTPFSVEAAKRLQSMGVAAWKIGSGEVSFLPLLAFVAGTKKPVVMSCGIHTDAEVATAVRCLGGRENVALLFCDSRYEKVPARGLAEALCGSGDCDGLSDHSGDSRNALAATCHGALIVEVHVTLDGKGLDAKSSIPTSRVARLLEDVDWFWQSTLSRGPRVDIGGEIANLARHDRRSDWRRGV